MRVVGLDVGTKTIGVAITDPLGMFAQPVTTLARKSVVKDTAAIARLCEERGVEHVVVGLPLELDGTEERSARLARQIGTAVGEATGLPVDYVDERFSSVEEPRRARFEVSLREVEHRQVGVRFNVVENAVGFVNHIGVVA